MGWREKPSKNEENQNGEEDEFFFSSSSSSIRFALAHAPYVTLGKAHVRNNKKKRTFFFYKLNWFLKSVLFSILTSQGLC